MPSFYGSYAIQIKCITKNLITLWSVIFTWYKKHFFFAEPIVGGGFQWILILLFSREMETLIGGFSFSEKRARSDLLYLMLFIIFMLMQDKHSALLPKIHCWLFWKLSHPKEAFREWHIFFKSAAR